MTNESALSGAPSGFGHRSWGHLIGAACLVFPSAAVAQSVLERVLQQIAVSGLFVNAAQSGFAPHGARIDASITTIFAADSPGDAIVRAWSPPALEIGYIEALALGATNAGEQILGLSAAVSTSDQADVAVLPGVTGAMTILLGSNSTLHHEVDLARIDDLIALSMRTDFDYRQSAAAPDAAVVALNMAANSGDVSARVLTRVEAVKMAASDITTTAIGSVNTGVSKISGTR